MSELLSAASSEGIPDSGRLVLGFSGGADSAALAHWLAARVERERIQLAHVNHGLRGEESDRDEAAAEAFAQALGLRFVVKRVPVRRLAAERGLGLEETGRALRYEFFESLAPREQDRILTAHNADDNAETVLLNLIRGAGLRGLCGIPARRGKVLRPLLPVSREEIEAYCQEHGLSYVTDSSNFSDEYRRNRIRLEVAPLLRQFNPRLAETLGRTAQTLREDEALLSAQAQALLEEARLPEGCLDCKRLCAAPKPLRIRALRDWLEEAGCRDLERRHLDILDEILHNVGEAAQLPGGVTVRRGRGRLYFGEKFTK